MPRLLQLSGNWLGSTRDRNLVVLFRRANPEPTRKPRSLCTRAATMPVNERSDCAEILIGSIRTSGGCVRGSVEELASVHAARAKGSRPTTIARGTARLRSMFDRAAG